MQETATDKRMNAPVSSKKEIARLNYLRIAPRKTRAIAGIIKGLSVNEAEAQLVVQGRRAAKPILKLLRSAVAGAVRNKKMNAENLYIENIRVDKGPMLKRILPRARGMATPIQKKMSHVTLVLAEKPGLKSGRFKIEVKKKVKKELQERPKKEKKQQLETEKQEHIVTKQPGFFKRIFRRKSV